MRNHQQFVVKLDRASSLTGIAFIGPDKADGFKVDNKETAARFDSIHEAGQFASNFKNRWRGFHGFSSSDIVVEAI